MERVRVASNTEIVRKDGRYFRVCENKHTKSKAISEMDFSKSNKIRHRTGPHSLVHYDKVKLDILFELENQSLSPKIKKTA